MSASPQHTQSTKRPLEETSSPSRNDQPDAKRPALDKVIRDEEESKELVTENNGDNVAAPAEVPAPAADTTTESSGNGTTAGDDEIEKLNGIKSEVKDDQGDTVVPDAPETKPIATTTTASLPPQSQSTAAQTHDETAWIHVRAVISSPEAATIIGKGGENVSKIRQMSNAKCTVSDYQKGAVERILTVSGVVDAVAKVNKYPTLSLSFLNIVLTLDLGIWFDHPHSQQRASGRSVKHTFQDVSSPSSRPPHPDWIDHWQGRCPYQGNPRGFRCSSQCLGFLPSSLQRALARCHGCG